MSTQRDGLVTSDITISSSPARTPAIFSDDAAPSSTLPSSPPGFPWERQEEQKAASMAKCQTSGRSVFSLLGKRKALDDLPNNARPAKKLAPSKPERKSKTLTQMQISLGQEVQKRCKTCGMEYVPSSADDRRLHDKYHKQNTDGYDVGKDFVARAREHSVFPAIKQEDAICRIDCLDSQARKRRGQDVLEIVQRELGAVKIPREQLWGARSTVDAVQSGQPKYKTYMYIRGTKCVGVLLAQYIQEAYNVTEPAVLRAPLDAKAHKTAAGALHARQTALAEQLKQPLRLSEELHPARLGISRIWTSPTHRQHNIATSLLQAALHDHNQCAARDGAGVTMDEGANLHEPWAAQDARPTVYASESKECMAFSQPTEAGTRLARRWFGRDYGWSVYFD